MANSLNHLLVHQFMKLFGDLTAAGQLAAACVLPGLCRCRFPAGIYAERFGTRRVLEFGLVLFAVSSALIAAATWSTMYVAVLHQPWLPTTAS